MPERPEVSTTAEELYSALAPAFTQLDEVHDWALLKLCAALTTNDLDLIGEIVSDTESGPGWQVLLDPARCPAQALPFLAQFVGAHLTPSMSEAQQRAAIAEPQGFGRGTPAAIIEVTKRRLTGTKFVAIQERYTGLPYRLKVSTIESETPEPAQTEADIIREQKPIGIRLYFNASPPWTWAELQEEESTWAKVIAKYATWGDLIAHSP